MPTYLRQPNLTINPFHRNPFTTDAYAFRLRGADNPGDFYREKTKDVQDIIADHLERSHK